MPVLGQTQAKNRHETTNGTGLGDPPQHTSDHELVISFTILKSFLHPPLYLSIRAFALKLRSIQAFRLITSDRKKRLTSANW